VYQFSAFAAGNNEHKSLIIIEAANKIKARKDITHCKQVAAMITVENIENERIMTL
jgi:hypothetical protein